MRSFLFIFCVLLSLSAVSQDLSKKIEEMREHAATQSMAIDSMRKRTDSLMLVQSRITDSINMAAYLEQNTRNLENFMKQRKEQERKQHQGMWLRIGAGILLLEVGIFGVIRKRKPKTGGTGFTVSQEVEKA
jgi:hypothetical protein